VVWVSRGMSYVALASAQDPLEKEVRPTSVPARRPCRECVATPPFPWFVRRDFLASPPSPYNTERLNAVERFRRCERSGHRQISFSDPSSSRAGELCRKALAEECSG